jgi:hypothetical protein
MHLYVNQINHGRGKRFLAFVVYFIRSYTFFCFVSWLDSLWSSSLFAERLTMTLHLVAQAIASTFVGI